MKKILLPMLAVLALLTACTNDNEFTTNEPDGNNAIKVQLVMPENPNGSRAEGTAYTVATEAERKVQTLDAYLFDATGTLEKVYKNLVTEWTPATLEEGKEVTLNNIPTREAKTILFVANGSAVTSLMESAAPGSINRTAFDALLTDALTDTPACPLLMTAEASVTAWNEEASITVSAALTRVVARLDLTLKDVTGVGFELEKAELLNVNTLSYIFPNETLPQCETINLTNEGETLTYEEVADKDIAGDDIKNYAYKHLFYVYAANASQMTLRLYGTQTIGGTAAKAIYDIPLSKMFAEEEAKVVRNTCYGIIVKDIDVTGANPGGIDVDFVVSK